MLPYTPSIPSFNTHIISQFSLDKTNLAIFPLIFSLSLSTSLQFARGEWGNVLYSCIRRSFSPAYCICSSYKAVCKRAIGTWITRPINEYKRHSDAVFTRWNGRVVCHRRHSQPLWLNYRRARNSASFKSALFAAAHLENCIFDSFPANFFHFFFLLPPSFQLVDLFIDFFFNRRLFELIRKRQIWFVFFEQ